MALDLLLDEIRGMPDELIMQIVRFAKFLKSEYAHKEAPVDDTSPSLAHTNRIAGKRRGQISLSEDFDDPIVDFSEYM